MNPGRCNFVNKENDRTRATVTDGRATPNSCLLMTVGPGSSAKNLRLLVKFTSIPKVRCVVVLIGTFDSLPPLASVQISSNHSLTVPRPDGLYPPSSAPQHPFGCPMDLA